MAFEFDGEKYRKASSHQKEWGARLLANLALSGSERVLDLGCGDGALTARIAALVPSGAVVGLDASSGMIGAAAVHRAENLTFTTGDINDIDFDEEFDVVFSNATLHWVKDHRRLLANVLRSLKKGGIVRFNFAGDGNCANFYRVVREAMGLGEYAPFFETFVWPWYMPSVGEYRSLVGEFDFAEAEVSGENADRAFPDEAALTGWIDQPCIVPFLGYLPEEKRQGFRDLVCRRMASQTRRDDGTFFETFRRINVFARKQVVDAVCGACGGGGGV